MDSLREKVARAIEESLGKARLHTSETAYYPEADAAIAAVLDEVERHLSAVQYSPSPYTDMKHRLRSFLQEQSAPTDGE